MGLVPAVVVLTVLASLGAGPLHWRGVLPWLTPKVNTPGKFG